MNSTASVRLEAATEVDAPTKLCDHLVMFIATRREPCLALMDALRPISFAKNEEVCCDGQMLRIQRAYHFYAERMSRPISAMNALRE